MNADELEEFTADVEGVLSEADGALPDAHDEDLAAWLKGYLRENLDMLALACEDEEVRANVEAIFGESVEAAMGLKSNTARMLLSFDPGNVESLEGPRTVRLTM